MSEARKGKKLSVEHRRKISESGKGRTFSVEHRRKLSEAHKGKKGKLPSAETRRKLSEAHKGERNHFYGKKHSAETRRKISESRKRLPEYMPAHKFYFSLPPDIPLKEKRKLLYTTFPHVKKRTIYKWVRKWKPSD